MAERMPEKLSIVVTTGSRTGRGRGTLIFQCMLF